MEYITLEVARLYQDSDQQWQLFLKLHAYVVLSLQRNKGLSENAAVMDATTNALSQVQGHSPDPAVIDRAQSMEEQLRLHRREPTTALWHLRARDIVARRSSYEKLTSYRPTIEDTLLAPTTCLQLLELHSTRLQVVHDANEDSQSLDLINIKVLTMTARQLLKQALFRRARSLERMGQKPEEVAAALAKLKESTLHWIIQCICTEQPHLSGATNNIMVIHDVQRPANLTAGRFALYGIISLCPISN
jgi:hypothetical protein